MKIKALLILTMIAVSLLSVTAANAASASYTYDELNRLTQITYDDGTVINYTYDEIGNRTVMLPASTSALTLYSPMGSGISTTPTYTWDALSGATGYNLLLSDGVTATTTSYTAAQANCPAGTGLCTILQATPLANGAHSWNVQVINAQGPGAWGFGLQFDVLAQYPIIFTAGPNGSVTGAASQIVNYTSSASSVTAVPATGYYFANWTGTGGFVTTISNPLIVSNVTATQSITANFGNFPVRLARSTPVYFSTLQDAYNAAVDNDVIQSQAQVFTGNLNTNRNISVTLAGGYACDYGSNPGTTRLQGVLTTSSGTLTIKDIILSN